MKMAACVSESLHDIKKEIGDVNGDGVLDISDATLILTYYAYSAAGSKLGQYNSNQLKQILY
ncbi:MAG: hypothetical protein ACI4JN_10085 [Ruminococcus sp.]